MPPELSHPLKHHKTYWRTVAAEERKNGFHVLADSYEELARKAEELCGLAHSEPCWREEAAS